MERVEVTIYTDPGCPFGFNAQRQELQLVWHYGAALAITRKMIVLTEKSASFEELGLSREMIAANAVRLRSSYGMPMRTAPPDHLLATIHACRAYVGARIHDAARADLLLRSLRRRAFSDGQPLDEVQTIHAAGADAGISVEMIDAWLADERVNMRFARTWRTRGAPLPEALALPHRLSRSDGRLRYSTASAVFETWGPSRCRTGLPAIRGVRGRGRQRRPDSRTAVCAADCRRGPVMGALSARHRRDR